MAEHLSDLALDNLAAELPVDLPTSSHLATCSTCRAKLEALKAERGAVLKAPQFNALLGKLQASTPPKRSMPGWAPVVLALAAALVVLVGVRFLPRDDGTILKGEPTVELLDASGAAVTSAHVSDKLSLAVGGAGQTAVAAFTVDDEGEVTLLVPSTPLAAGAQVPVGSVFEVTPGSLAVLACFGDHPLNVDALRSEIFRRGLQTKKTPREVIPPEGCAKTELEVLP